MARKTIVDIYREANGRTSAEGKFVRALQLWCLEHGEARLAKKVGVAPLTIRRIATGTTSPRLCLALKICREIGFRWERI